MLQNSKKKKKLIKIQYTLNTHLANTNKIDNISNNN